MTVQIINSDCRDALRSLPDKSVHCVVTSPPYWGLRDYGTATWEGGDTGCAHINGTLTNNKSTLRSGGRKHVGPYANEKALSIGMPYRLTCGKCGARRIDTQIGLEVTPAEYVDTMVEVFREVKRVLRDDGTLWLNLGQSYAYASGGTFKPKDMVPIPWLVAIALQQDGWTLRSDIIWHKPNQMPESVQDRPTSAHDYLFLLAKSRRYYYDAKAIAEPSSHTTHLSQREVDRIMAARAAGANTSVGSGRRSAKVHAVDGMVKQNTSFENAVCLPNKRTVWTIPTSYFRSSHFATFPPKLVEPCVLAGTSAEGCCAKCGAPWARKRRTDDWAPTCACDVATVPCTVLDPFFGAGTTGLVAARLGRACIGIELSAEYCAMARHRIEQDAPLLTEEVVITA